MRFKKATDSNKTELDLHGNLILSKNTQLVSAPSKKRAPEAVSNARYIILTELTFWQKVKACFLACHYIWSKKK